MPWIIDGNNVMGARPDRWWRDRAGAQARLAAVVDRWQHLVAEPVCLVFDGRADAEVTGRSRPGYEIRYSGSNVADSADAVIVEVVTALLADGADRSPTVVTSDRGLIARLPPSVVTMGAGTFRRRLDAADAGGSW